MIISKNKLIFLDKNKKINKNKIVEKNPNLDQIKKVENTEKTAFINLLMDLEFNWSKNYEAILNSTQYPDFKVMTYFKYSQLLKIELRNEEFILAIFKMNEEFPLMIQSFP